MNCFHVRRSDNIRKKISIVAQDILRETLFHFPRLLKHHQENNFSFDKYHFKIITSNIREAFASRFQKFKNSRTTLAFVKNPLNPTITELKLSSFETDICSFEIQLLNLKKKQKTKKNKEIW